MYSAASSVEVDSNEDNQLNQSDTASWKGFIKYFRTNFDPHEAVDCVSEAQLQVISQIGGHIYETYFTLKRCFFRVIMTV